MTDRGPEFFDPEGVPVALGPTLLDLGPESLELARTAAQELGFEFSLQPRHVMGIPRLRQVFAQAVREMAERTPGTTRFMASA